MRMCLSVSWGVAMVYYSVVPYWVLRRSVAYPCLKCVCAAGPWAGRPRPYTSGYVCPPGPSLLLGYGRSPRSGSRRPWRPRHWCRHHPWKASNTDRDSLARVFGPGLKYQQTSLHCSPGLITGEVDLRFNFSVCFTEIWTSLTISKD